MGHWNLSDYPAGQRESGRVEFAVQNTRATNDGQYIDEQCPRTWC